jgi:molybdate-binding protein
MAQEEIINIKAELYDIICQQEEHVAAANAVQQEKIKKVQQLKNGQQQQNLSPEDIIKLKAEIFDMILKQEEYMAVANALQQNKSHKLQQLADIQRGKPLQNV